MTNKFINTIVFVSNLDRSKKFYVDMLGIKIKEELETIIFFDNHLVLHCAKSILNTVFKVNHSDIPEALGTNNILIYFECKTLCELQELYENIKDKVRIIHGIEVQEWGQKVFRFFDPDGHIVEFGERQN